MQTIDEVREHCRSVDKGGEKALAERNGLGFAKSADALGLFNNIQQQLYVA